jgi:hypothetical protein
MSGEQPAHPTDDPVGAPAPAAVSSQPPPRSFTPASGASAPLSVDFIGGSGSGFGASSTDGGGDLTFDVPSRPVTVIQMMAEVNSLGSTQFLNPQSEF